jgi:1,4-alpha-glucan branching enzyme
VFSVHNVSLAQYSLAMKRMLLLISTMVLTMCLRAQLLTWTPPFPTENDPAQTLVITVNANKGNKGLLNYTPTSDVFVHLGVITNLSTGANDWKYVKFNQNFSQPNPALQATSIGNNQWAFTINGSLKSYFGVPAGETIRKIAILFRSGNGSKKQANTDNSDMYIPVYTTELALQVLEPAMQPLFNPQPESQSVPVGTQTFKVAVNKPSSVTLDAGNGAVQTLSVTNEQTFTVNYTTAGLYEVKVSANDGAQTVNYSLSLTVGSVSSPMVDLPANAKDGINYEAGGTAATLVLHAPGKNIVTVIGDFNNWTASSSYIMNKTPDGKKFWLRLQGLTPGTEYGFQYQVDNALKVADPYAEKILDPYNDGFISATTYPGLKAYPTGKTTGMVGVLQPGAPTYNWSVTNFARPDKRGLVIYELLLRDFLGNHDWKTLSDTLSYLKRLGVNAIELMPPTEFEGNSSWGYNTFQYFATDKYYGPANQLKAFIDKCHQNGIAVIMDMVLNHTYGPSPLAQLYWDSNNNRPATNNPWYNAVQPHAFGFGEDFNHESADTKYFFTRVLQHWLTEYKIDGYRLDFTKGLTQKVSTNDATFSAFDASRVTILNGYANAVKAVVPDAYIILEHLADNTEEKQLADNGMMLWANVWTRYQEAAMGYVANSNTNLEWGVHTVRGWNNPHLVTFMESHDEERVTYKSIKYGNVSGSYSIKDTVTALKRMELNAAFLLTIPGPKMIWQFGELGYDFSRCYLSSNNDESGNCDKKLDPKPIRWDYQNEARRQRVYNTYSSLNALRFHTWYKDLFQSGTIEQNLRDGFKWLKVASGDTSMLVVVGNFDVVSTNGTVTFPTAGTWFDYFSNTTFTTTGAAQTITLQPGEYRVYVNRNVNNIAVTPVVNIPTSGTKLEAKLFPNPVNTNYVVELYVPQSGTTRFDLLNLAGQQVGTLQQKFLVKGKHQLSFNRNGLPAAAGTYYIRVYTTTAQKIIPITLH